MFGFYWWIAQDILSSRHFMHSALVPFCWRQQLFISFQSCLLLLVTVAIGMCSAEMKLCLWGNQYLLLPRNELFHTFPNIRRNWNAYNIHLRKTPRSIRNWILIPSFSLFYRGRRVSLKCKIHHCAVLLQWVIMWVPQTEQSKLYFVIQRRVQI